MTKHRETKSGDWKKIDDFFDKAYNAFENDEMTYDQYKKWITHYIGLANNEGIEAVLTGMENSLQFVAKNGWQAP